MSPDADPAVAAGDPPETDDVAGGPPDAEGAAGGAAETVAAGDPPETVAARADPPGADDVASAGQDAGPTATCAACGEPLVAGASFCEACGAPAGARAPAAGAPGDAEAAGTPAGGVPTVSTPGGAVRACVACGGEIDADGYCTTCGRRAPDPVAVDDRGTLASATHKGRRYPRNEDAAALAATAEGWPVLVVSDGVSASPNPHDAAAVAVAAAADRLAGRPFAGDADLVAAVEVAHAAASAVPAEGDPKWPADGTHPACTIAVAVATPTAVHAANVGDARVHVLTPAGDAWAAAQVSTDDSVAAHAVAQGVEVEVALALPGGHGITAWLGADAPALDPHLATHPTRPGALLLACSDGLWNYAPTDAALGDLVTAVAPPPGPAGWPGPAAAADAAGAPVAPAELAAVCERLVAWANDQGGADNITVALAAVPEPAAPTPEAGPPAPGPAEPTELEDKS
ncbi:MAG TPA: protein phosphatase 2C domain-containing protein [Acidimicrobiales bacterium]